MSTQSSQQSAKTPTQASVLPPRIARRTARAFAPATIGNIGPGFDILGLAVEGLGDEVTATIEDSTNDVSVENYTRVRIVDAGHPDLPTDPTKHTSGIAAIEVLRIANVKNVSIALSVKKGLALSGGQGGSAASAVAGAVAVNALLDTQLSSRELMMACLVAESHVAGRHLDNIAPCILGGCVIVHDVETCDVTKLPTPPGLQVVLAHPHQHMRTSEGRSVVPTTFDRATTIAQAANVASLVAAFLLSDDTLLAKSIHDFIAEPARAPLLIGFIQAKAAALAAGALGCSISGSGPTAFAFARPNTATQISEAMRTAYATAGIACDLHIGNIDTTGARVM